MDLSDRIKVPKELIAQHPAERRGASRLLGVSRSRGIIFDGVFNEGLRHLIKEGDLVVFNQSKVINARLKATSKLGDVDLVVVGPFSGNVFKVLVRDLRKYEPGDTFEVSGYILVFEGREGAFGILRSGEDISVILDRAGQPPIPPYIRGGRAVEEDYYRYQNIYAKDPGSIAAPTAGLHFDEESFSILSKLGARIAYLTLHVGPSSIAEHLGVTAEVFEIPELTIEILQSTPVDRTIAVGTTTIRSLETFGSQGRSRGETSLIISPGYSFTRVGKFFTNFHLPDSSHIKIVSAYLGIEQTVDAYEYAVKNRFRFFSYGDSMFCCP